MGGADKAFMGGVDRTMDWLVEADGELWDWFMGMLADGVLHLFLEGAD